ncbi:Lactate utilization protein B [subsurface metagenome]
MPEPKQIFEDYYDELLHSAHDRNISLGLSRSVSAYRANRVKALERFPHTVELAKEVRRLKEDCVEHLDELVQKASATLEENGAKVYYAESADDALKLIGEIVGSGKVVVSGKTLTGEEIELRHHLEGLGNEFWETDTAQFLQQLREERPMHYVYPSLHVTREEVAGTLTNLLGREIPPDIPVEVRTIREFLRGKYFKADVGISGCNVLGADTGSIFLLESEGNIRMSTTVPPVHITLVGIEKVVPTLHDAFNVAEVLWRYAGFTIPLYVSLISGPSGTADIECTLIHGSSGPVELHVIFLDNGRSRLAKDPILKEALYCIKCGGCLFECPVFELTAGYYGGGGYFGGLGAILTAYFGGGLDKAAPIAYTCLRCGRCTEVCPLSIDLSKLIPELRHRITEIARR